MKHIRRLAFLILILTAAVMLTACGSDLTGRWTEYKTESYVLEDGVWSLEDEKLPSDTGRDPVVAEFYGNGSMKIDDFECDYEIEDSYLRMYQDGYLETDLIHIDGSRLVIQARYDDELKVIYFNKN